MDTFHGPYFHFCLELAVGNLSQGFIDTFSMGSQPWTHPLIGKHPIVSILRPENAPPD